MSLRRIGLVLLVALAATTCSGERVVLYVGPQRVACTGVAQQQCLLVRSNEREDWQYFYSAIEGFAFEPGYFYKLLVRKDRVDIVVPDQSSLRWRLIRILSRTRAAQE